MINNIQTLVDSYRSPTRQLGAVSSSQIVTVTPNTNFSDDAIIKQQIIDTVFPPSQRQNRAGWNTSALQEIIDALDNGFINHYYGDRANGVLANDCAQANRSDGNINLAIANKAASLGASVAALGIGTAAHGSALAAIGLGVNIAPVVGQIISGALIAFSVISGVFQHHAQAVAQEQTILCAIIPAINNAILGLDSAIAQGRVSLQDAYNGMDNLYQAYLQNVKPILQETASQCNAACVEDRALIALITYKKYQYGKIVASNPTALVANSLASATGLSIGNSKILLYGVIAIVFFFLVRR